MLYFLSIVFLLLVFPTHAFAAFENNDVSNFANQSLQVLLVIASLASALFLIKGGYAYMTSNGKPENLEHAKKTIRNSIIGLVIILSATVFQSLLMSSFTIPNGNTTASQINLTPIEPVTPNNGLTQVLLDAISGFLQTIIQSATKPLVDGIVSMITTTPSLINNSVIFNYWLIILGITDSLYVLLIAILGFHFMSASTFGFDEIELKHLLPRIGLSFLGANMSIFLADWIVLSGNTLIKALLNSTGGLTTAWVLNAFDPAALSTKTFPVITLIFMLLFVILCIVLLLLYISRLIVIALGAVLSPLIFLAWAIPKGSDFAEITIKSYIVSVFTVFVHVAIIQLASAFLAIPGQQGVNPLISILVAIALFFTLLKTQSIMMQFVFYNTGRGIIRKIGGQIVNVVSNNNPSGATARAEAGQKAIAKTPRKVIAA